MGRWANTQEDEGELLKSCKKNNLLLDKMKELKGKTRVKEVVKNTLKH